MRALVHEVVAGQSRRAKLIQGTITGLTYAYFAYVTAIQKNQPEAVLIVTGLLVLVAALVFLT